MKLLIKNIVTIAGIIVAITASCQWGQTKNFGRIQILDMKLRSEIEVPSLHQESGMIALLEEFKNWQAK